MVARASKQDSEETARRILSEAEALFAGRGYAGVGLEEIADAASVTRGAVYHHFGSKKGLFEAVAGRTQQKVADAVVQAAARQPNSWEGLRAGCRAFLTASLSDGARRILLVDAPSVLGWNAWRHQDADASALHLRDALMELVALGAIEVRSVAGATALLSGAMNEAALCIADSDRRDDALEDALVDLFRILDGLRKR